MKYSYHIMQKFGDHEGSWICMWPYASFGHYCINLGEARAQFKAMVTENPDGKYKLVKYRGITRGWICKSVVGIIGAPIFIERN